MPKGCPFCAREPEIWPHDPQQEGDAWAEVACVNPRCPTFRAADGCGVRVSDGARCAYATWSPADFKRAAVRRWNRRWG